MGISGLLPLLKSIQQPTHIKEFAGQVVGVDGYVWLHRGAIACAVDLALGRPTRKYVDYAMHRVHMLQHYGVKPYLVFDGANLPSKRHTEIERKKSRDEARQEVMKLFRAGRSSEAYQCCQKAIDITPAMASLFIRSLEKENIPYVVAPYEADAQLAYLEKKNIISAVVSEDSDLLVFGVRCLLTKLNEYGDCIAIKRSKLGECKDLDLSSFDDTLFRHMAILSGCDYTPGIPNVGLKKSHIYLKRYRNAERAMQFMALDGKINIPMGFRSEFERADITFKHQRVYDPIEERVVMWTKPVGYDLPAELDHAVGPPVEDELAKGIARGLIDPSTHKPIPVLGSPGKTHPSPDRLPDTKITQYIRTSPSKRSKLQDITNTEAAARQSSSPKSPAKFSKRSLPLERTNTDNTVAKRVRALSPPSSGKSDENRPARVVTSSQYFASATKMSSPRAWYSSSNHEHEISAETVAEVFSEIEYGPPRENGGQEKTKDVAREDRTTKESMAKTVCSTEKHEVQREATIVDSDASSQAAEECTPETPQSRFAAFKLTHSITSKSRTEIPSVNRVSFTSTCARPKPSSEATTPQSSRPMSTACITGLPTPPSSFASTSVTASVTPLPIRNRFEQFSASPALSQNNPPSGITRPRAPTPMGRFMKTPALHRSGKQSFSGVAIRRPTFNSKGIGRLSTPSRTASLDRYISSPSERRSSSGLESKSMTMNPTATAGTGSKQKTTASFSFQSHLDRFRAP